MFDRETLLLLAGLFTLFLVVMMIAVRPMASRRTLYGQAPYGRVPRAAKRSSSAALPRETTIESPSKPEQHKLPRTG